MNSKKVLLHTVGLESNRNIIENACFEGISGPVPKRQSGFTTLGFKFLVFRTLDVKTVGPRSQKERQRAESLEACAQS